jgi:hypothetical protein
MVGTIKSWGKWFIIRRKRRCLRDVSERLHPSAVAPHEGPRRLWFVRQV